MEVNDVKSEIARVESGSNPPSSSISRASQHEQLTANDSVELSAPHRDVVVVVNEVRAKVNKVIATVNYTGNVTYQVRDLVKSLGGLIEQASDEGSTDHRKKKLQEEADHIVQQLEKVLKDQDSSLKLSTESELTLTTGDDSSFENQASLLRSEDLGLQGIVVEDTQNASNRVSKAQQVIAKKDAQIVALKRDLVATLERDAVLAQNHEASRTQVRDVDKALQESGVIQRAIRGDPTSALHSFGTHPQRLIPLLD